MLDLLIEIVGGVLGCPEAVIEAVVVEQRAVGFGVGPAFALEGEFGDEFPIELAGTMFEQFLKGGADGGFVFDAELFELGQAFVINEDGLVGGLRGQAGPGGFL